MLKSLMVLLLGLVCLSQAKFFYEIEYEEEFSILERYNGSLEAALADKGISLITKAEFIEMRDGIQLYTAIHVPILGRNLGCVLERTSYTTIYSAALALRWLPRGFAVALQDQRGTGISRGDNFRFWRLDGPDGYDTMEFLTSQSWSNGNIFMTGASSMGNAVIAGLLLYPPWVKAFAPQVFTGNGHVTTYQGGAFRQGLVGNWLTVLGFIFTLQEVKENEAYSIWWDPITITGKEDRCSQYAVAAGGWYDIFLNETIDGFNACQYLSPSAGRHKLVIAPGGHCTGGDYNWANSRSSIQTDITHALFLEHNGDDVPDNLAERVAEADAITLYIMGPEDTQVGAYWTTIPDWPTVYEMVLYMHGDGRLDTLPPTTGNASITYTYDPDNPVRTNGGNEMFLPCGPRRQDEIGARDDVISFVSSPLPSHTPLVGDVKAIIYVSTSAVDTDFTVKLSDQYPNGDAYNIVDGIIRLKWRGSLERPTPAVPGEVYEVEVSLWKTGYIFEAGHSVRVDVSSSNHPRFEKNPNNGLPITENGDVVVARNTLLFDRGHPSRIILPTVSINEIPNNFNP